MISPDWLRPIYFVDWTRVNLDDLCAATRPGQIVRVDGDPRSAVQLVTPDGSYDFVAGMVSENA